MAQENKKTHLQKERAERAKQALQLRLEGDSYPRIAEKLGHSQSTIYTDVQKALRDIPKPEADQLRKEEQARLDLLQKAVWNQALDGDVASVDRAVKIIDRRIRLLGLDAPSQLEVSGGSDLDVDGAVRALVAAAQGKTAQPQDNGEGEGQEGQEVTQGDD